MFWWLQYPIHVTTRGDFLNFQILLWASNIAQEFPPRGKANRNVLYFLIKGSSFTGVWLLLWLPFFGSEIHWCFILWRFSYLHFIEILWYLSILSLTYLSFSLWKVSPFECCQFTQLLVRPFRYSIFTVFSNTAFLFNFYILLQIWIIYIE